MHLRIVTFSIRQTHRLVYQVRPGCILYHWSIIINTSAFLYVTRWHDSCKDECINNARTIIGERNNRHGQSALGPKSKILKRQSIFRNSVRLWLVWVIRPWMWKCITMYVKNRMTIFTSRSDISNCHNMITWIDKHYDIPF